MTNRSRKETKNYIAILDIGSNAVRLVVFDGPYRAPVRIHNERTICSLGADLGRTGRLNPDGVIQALDSIGRFSGLLAAMKINNIYAVATAALRDAEDGQKFIVTVREKFGLEIRIVEGDEEARLSAMGVMMNGMCRDGIIGDFGGGSLEIIQIENSKVKHKTSLPLGSHRLEAAGDRAQQIALIDTALETVPFLKHAKDLDFYALGGSWRALAKMHMRMVNHPIDILDHYMIAGDVAEQYAAEIAAENVETLEQREGLSKKRVRDVSVAALALHRVFVKLAPRRLYFSGTGLREGLIYEALPSAVQRQDALISGVRRMALKISRFDDIKAFSTLFQWMQPLFPGAAPAVLRLIEAASLLSDTAWFEHEDVQARHTFERILVLPFYGIDHAGRVFLAVTQYVRYAGRLDGDAARIAGQILTPQETAMATVAGLAMKTAYMMTGGALSLLKETNLSLSADALTLNISGTAKSLHAAIIEDAMKKLAASLHVTAKIA